MTRHRLTDQERDLSEEYQPWGTVWDLFDKWNSDGTLDETLHRLLAMHLDAGEIDEELWCIDGRSSGPPVVLPGAGKKPIQTSLLTRH